MTTATLSAARTRRSKTPRSIRLLARLGDGSGLFQVTEGKTIDRYFFRPAASDWGRAFVVEKWQDATDAQPAGVVATYDVCLDDEGGRCDCRGNERHGHCRHVSGLATLVEEGML
jgi:hypothetical protein